MKRVVIVRHAKADSYSYEDDFNRTLTERGKMDAAIISAELKRRGIKADIMVSSSAKRAVETAHIFAENLGFEINNIFYERIMYNGITVSQFLELVYESHESAETVFFFGHNPDFHFFVVKLLHDFGIEMPTCSTVGIDFDVELWKEVEVRKGKKAFHLTPQMFR